MDIKDIVRKFITDQNFQVSVIENGLINQTYLIDAEQGKFILQRINTQVFKNPKAIVNNHLEINKYLEKAQYSGKTVKIFPTLEGEYLATDFENGSWRMTEFIENTQTFLKVPDSEIAFRAAKCFSEFYAILNSQTIGLEETLPDFINFKKRTSDFQEAINNANSQRLANSKPEIEFLKSLIDLPNNWLKLDTENQLPKRSIHADPKISNILFGADNKVVAVIDLDTMMTSTLLYDFGDMIRSYCNTTQEDDGVLEENFSIEIYQSVKEGFLFHLKEILTPTEIENLDYAARVVIYIQAVRFLTDYLNNDVYYSIKYETHNLDRTKNQVNLLKNLVLSI